MVMCATEPGNIIRSAGEDEGARGTTGAAVAPPAATLEATAGGEASGGNMALFDRGRSAEEEVEDERGDNSTTLASDAGSRLRRGGGRRGTARLARARTGVE